MYLFLGKYPQVDRMFLPNWRDVEMDFWSKLLEQDPILPKLQQNHHQYHADHPVDDHYSDHPSLPLLLLVLLHRNLCRVESISLIIIIIMIMYDEEERVPWVSAATEEASSPCFCSWVSSTGITVFFWIASCNKHWPYASKQSAHSSASSPNAAALRTGHHRRETAYKVLDARLNKSNASPKCPLRRAVSAMAIKSFAVATASAMQNGLFFFPQTYMTDYTFNTMAAYNMSLCKCYLNCTKCTLLSKNLTLLFYILFLFYYSTYYSYAMYCIWVWIIYAYSMQ